MLPALTIRRKLLLLVLLAVLPAFGLVLRNGLNRQQQARDAALSSATHIANELALRQMQTTASTRQFLATLARLPQVQAQDNAACAALFPLLLRENPIYNNIVLADAQGRVLATALPRPEGLGVAATPYFRAAVAARGFTVGGHYASASTGQHVLAFGLPLFGPEGRLAGVLGIGQRLDHYEGVVRDVDLPEGATIAMGDRNGVRLFHHSFPEPRPELYPVGAPIKGAIWRKLMASEPGQPFYGTGMDGLERLYVTQKLSLAPGQEPYFFTGVSIPEERILAKARAAILDDLALLGLAALCSAVVAWVFGDQAFVRRIERLALVAGRFARGEFSARAGLPQALGGADELWELSQAMDQIGEDLSRREAEREATLARLRRTQFAVDNAGDEIYWADETGRFLYVNRRACQGLGYAEEELLRKGIFDLAPGFDPARWRGLLEVLAGIGPATIEMVHRTRAGVLVPKEITVSLLPQNGARLVFGAARDISERRRSEALLQSLLDETSSATGEAFFERITALMARQLGATAAFAAELLDTPSPTARTLAFHVRGASIPAVDYPLDGTPCADILPGGHLFVPSGLAQRYPQGRLFRELGAQAFLGVGLHGASGARIGHLVLLSETPLEADPFRLSAMRLLAQRASAELERLRAERAVLASLREKEVLLKEIHHRVKNNLQIISSLLSLQSRDTTDAAILDMVAQSRARIQSMALVHEDLYQTGNLAQVDFAHYLGRLAGRVGSGLAGGACVRFELDMEELSLSIDQAIPLGLLTNELLTNAVKHAFTGQVGREQVVQVRLRRENGQAELTVRDNGRGLPEDYRPGGEGSLGHMLVWTLAEQLRGSVTARNEDGAVFTLRFPVAPAP